MRKGSGIRGLGKETHSRTQIHLTKKRRNGTGGERATTVIARYSCDLRAVENVQNRHIDLHMLTLYAG